MYHTYMITNLRLILDIEVQTGDQASFACLTPGLWALLKQTYNSHELPPPFTQKPQFTTKTRGTQGKVIGLETKSLHHWVSDK